MVDMLKLIPEMLKMTWYKIKIKLDNAQGLLYAYFQDLSKMPKQCQGQIMIDKTSLCDHFRKAISEGHCLSFNDWWCPRKFFGIIIDSQKLGSGWLVVVATIKSYIMIPNENVTAISTLYKYHQTHHNVSPTYTNHDVI